MTIPFLPRIAFIFSARPAVTAALAAAAAIALFGASASPAHAQWVSTKELVDTYCDSNDAEHAAFCAGYVAGSLHVLMAPPNMFPKGRFCIDVEKQPKLSAIAERLVKLRKEEPELEATPAFTVIAAIIERGFPCPEEVLEATDAPADPAQQSAPTDLFGLPAEE